MTQRWLPKLNPVILGVKVKLNAVNNPILYRIVVKNQNKYYYITFDDVIDCIEELNLSDNQASRGEHDYAKHIAGRHEIEVNDFIYSKVYNILDKLRKNNIQLSNCHKIYIPDIPFNKIEFPYTGIDDIDDIDSSDELENIGLDEKQIESFDMKIQNKFEDIINNNAYANEFINEYSDDFESSSYVDRDEFINFVLKRYLDKYYKLLVNKAKVIEKLSKIKEYIKNENKELPLPLINIIYEYDFPDANKVETIANSYINKLISKGVDKWMDLYFEA